MVMAFTMGQKPKSRKQILKFLENSCIVLSVRLPPFFADARGLISPLSRATGFFTLYLYVSQENVDTVVKSLWLALCIILPADFIRFRWPRFERMYERVLGFLMRESEKVSPSMSITVDISNSKYQKSINGVVWYILGVNFVLSFYPRDVATV